tara:strand:+ start:445 stop:642 length:198 start_codon:yes stop_codon:yes gene_type:complete
MNKDEQEIISNNIENNSNQNEYTKTLCVHDLNRRIKEKKKKESFRKIIILIALIFLICLLFIFVY